MGAFLGSPAIDYYLKIETSKQLKEPVYNKLVKGSSPTMPVQRDSLEIIPRPQVMREIKEMFLPQQVESHTRFGVILGPSGSGKTYAIRKVCNLFDPMPADLFTTSVCYNVPSGESIHSWTSIEGY